MKAILLNHWQAKLTSLILAAVLWYLIKQSVTRNPERFEFGRDSAAETQKSQKKSPSK
jgi:YbbR domain-containing protein